MQGEPPVGQVPQEEKEGEIAGPSNQYDYNLYDRMQNKRDQQERQQYYYYQSQDQNSYAPYSNQPSPQYGRKKPLHSQYFDPTHE